MELKVTTLSGDASGSVTVPDGIFGLEPRADMFDGHREPGVAQSLLELAVAPSGPHRQGPAGLECGLRRGHAGVVVEPAIEVGRECRRPVVDVEQHGIKGPGMRAERLADVANHDARAPVREAVR